MSVIILTSTVCLFICITVTTCISRCHVPYKRFKINRCGDYTDLYVGRINNPLVHIFLLLVMVCACGSLDMYYSV